MGTRRDWRAEAAKIWPILVECAQRRATMTYGQLDERTGVFYRNQRIPLDHIGRHVLRNALPPLTIVIVDARTGRPGDGIVGTSPETFDVDIRRVFDFDWTKIINPFAVFLGTT